MERLDWREGLVVFYDASNCERSKKWTLCNGISSASMSGVSGAVVRRRDDKNEIEIDTVEMPTMSYRQNYLIFFSDDETFEWMDIRTNEIVQFETGNKYQ